MDGSPPDPSVRGILQVRTLELVAIPSPEDLPNPGVESLSPALIGRWIIYHGTTWASSKQQYLLSRVETIGKHFSILSSE